MSRHRPQETPRIYSDKHPEALGAAHWWPGVEFDEESVTGLRSLLIKPEHQRMLPIIIETLRAAAV